MTPETDWRAHVRKHPVATLGVALAGGVAIAMIADRRARRADRAPDPENRAEAHDLAAPNEHPVVDRVVSAIVAVAAGTALEVLDDILSDLVAPAETKKAPRAQPA